MADRSRAGFHARVCLAGLGIVPWCQVRATFCHYVEGGALAFWAKETTAQMRAVEREQAVQSWGAFYGDAGKQRVQRELAARFQQLWDAHAPVAYKAILYDRDIYQQNGNAVALIIEDLMEEGMPIPTDDAGQVQVSQEPLLTVTI